MRSTDGSERTNADEFVERLRALVAAQVTGSAQLMARFSEFVKDASKAVRETRPEQRADANALLSRWLDFNLESYSIVSSSALAILNELLSAAESTLAPKPKPTCVTTPASTQVFHLQLKGRQGDRVASGFELENKLDRPMTVKLLADELTPASGPPLSAEHIVFDPPDLLISPGGSATVHTAIMITDDFLVGQTYKSRIRLLGSEAKELGLSLTVQKSEPDANRVRSAPKQSKRQKKS